MTLIRPYVVGLRAACSAVFLISLLHCHSALADALDDWNLISCPSLPPLSPYQPRPALSKIITFQDLFVAIGTRMDIIMCCGDSPTVILTSNDGFNWSERTNPGADGFYGVAASENLIVGAGIWGQVLVSSNAVNWSGTNVFAPDVNWYAVAYGSNRFVVVGGDSRNPTPQSTQKPAIITSTNGLNWVRVNNYLTTPYPLVSVAYGDGFYLAGSRDWNGAAARQYYSRDGTNFLTFDYAVGVRAVCFGNRRFVRASDALQVLTNFPVWTAVSWPTAAPFDTLTFAAGMFVASSGRDLATSMDGFTWNVRTNALPDRAVDIAAGNGRLLAVGKYNQKYYLSRPVSEIMPGSAMGAGAVRGVAGRSYQVEASDVLNSTNWNAVNTFTLTNSPQSWSDPTPNLGTKAQRFYRSKLMP